MVYSLKRRSSTSAKTKPEADAERFGATAASEWMFLCLAYLVITFGITLLTITTAIQCGLIAVLEQTISATLFQGHHQRLRKLLTIGTRTSCRNRLPSSQSALRHYMNRNSLLCAHHVGGLHHVGGFDHIHYGANVTNNLYKQRGWQKTERRGHNRGIIYSGRAPLRNERIVQNKEQATRDEQAIFNEQTVLRSRKEAFYSTKNIA